MLFCYKQIDILISRVVTMMHFIVTIYYITIFGYELLFKLKSLFSMHFCASFVVQWLVYYMSETLKILLKLALKPGIMVGCCT